MTKATYYLDRFIGKIKFTSSCWEWIGTKDKDGYGRFSISSNPVQAHRLSYIEFVGNIPNNLVIDHLCRNTSCVNPNHLEVVTQKENTIRGTNFLGVYMKTMELNK